jgi:hypothetical protein
MNKFKLVTTAKTEGTSEQVVTTAAEKNFPGYRVAKIEDLGDKWQVRLDQEKVSTRTRQAAPPDFLKDDGGDSSDASDEDPKDSVDESDSSSDDSSDASDEADSDSKDKDKPDDSKGDSKKDPVKAIEGIMGELKSLLDQLGGHASDLKEKADKVDEIHNLTKGDVAPMDDVPPVPPLDDAALVGPTPGNSPVPPRKNPPPRPGMGAGVPGVFGSHQTEVVEHPMKDDDGEYALNDVLQAIASHPDLGDYEVEELKALAEDNVYVAKLKKKN